MQRIFGIVLFSAAASRYMSEATNRRSISISLSRGVNAVVNIELFWTCLETKGYYYSRVIDWHIIFEQDTNSC